MFCFLHILWCLLRHQMILIEISTDKNTMLKVKQNYNQMAYSSYDIKWEIYLARCSFNCELGLG